MEYEEKKGLFLAMVIRLLFHLVIFVMVFGALVLLAIKYLPNNELLLICIGWAIGQFSFGTASFFINLKTHRIEL